VYVKLQLECNSLALLLDGIERIKPMLAITSLVRSGRRIEFPITLKPTQRRQKALQNVIKIVKFSKERKLFHRILGSLLDFVALTKDDKFDLTEDRDALLDAAIYRKENLQDVRYLLSR
jgi:ribosomal protein S7